MMNNNHDIDNKNTAPPGYYVYYNPRVHQFKLLAILAICAVLISLPLMVAKTETGPLYILIVFVAGFLTWAYVTILRIRDRRPKVIIDETGIFVRDWYCNILPWSEIEFISHSSSVRRGIISALTRSRRGPYLLFKFANNPIYASSISPPLSYVHKIWIEMELQEPAIMEFGLDKKATQILSAIEEHIEYWQKSTRSDAKDNAVILSTN